MKKWIIATVIISCLLFSDSSVQDSVTTPLRPSVTYFPFNYDTVAVSDTTYSAWYWMNDANIMGVGTLSYEVDTIGVNNVALKIYRTYTNDTTWTCNKWVLIDSVVARKHTTEILRYYAAKWHRLALVGWQRVNAADKQRIRAKFTIK